MTVAARQSGVVSLLLLTALVLSTPAGAQNVSTAVDDLRSNDVTYESGALDEQDLDELDDTVSGLQGEGFFKVVVLSQRVTDFPSARAFSQAVLQRLGGEGTVLSYDPTTVGIASNVASSAEVSAGEQAAIDEANRTNSYAGGAAAAANSMFGTSVDVPGGGDGGGGGSWLFWLLILGGLAFLAFFLFRRMARSSKAGRKLGAEIVAAGAKKVRDANDRAANLILELSDRMGAPDVNSDAKRLYQAASSEFMGVQEALEDADTSTELEAIYPTIVDAGWKLDSAAAMLEGRPAPAKAEPGPLFPAPPPAPEGPRRVQVPEPHYKELELNPWLTTAAMSAMSILVSGGMGRSNRDHRQPMSDDMFGGLLDGLGQGGGWGGGRGGGRGRPTIRLGRGRGMGSR